MASVDLKPLISRLNDPCRRALEAAAGLTLSRSRYNIEIEHWLSKLLDAGDTDLPAILRHFEVDAGRLARDLNRTLDRLKTGNARPPALAPDILEVVKQAWLLASIELGASRIRSGHLVWALLADDALARRTRDAMPELSHIMPDVLKRDYAAITQGSTEAAPADEPGSASDAPRPAGTGALDQYH